MPSSDDDSPEGMTIRLDPMAARAVRELERDGTKRAVVIRRALVNEMLRRSSEAIAQDPEEQRLARETLAFTESLGDPGEPVTSTRNACNGLGSSWPTCLRGRKPDARRGCTLGSTPSATLGGSASGAGAAKHHDAG
jgi:hypothetical protein